MQHLRALRPDSASHNIPTLAGEQYVDGYYCSAHAGAALDAARTHLAALDFDDDTRDDMMPLVSFHALVRARGLMSETLDPPAPGVGMERVRNEALALLESLRHTRLPIVEPSALCSGCYRPVPASQVRVIPWFNDDLADFVTTFRCGDCVADSLADTRARLTAGGPVRSAGWPSSSSATRSPSTSTAAATARGRPSAAGAHPRSPGPRHPEAAARRDRAAE
ncbi:hypothetical protein [Nannocystis pusilla]|uniref:hypothetical protein n=1 Tax=Nannocystis pusilla TaxID=889268 RepID=UPI003B7C25B2